MLTIISVYPTCHQWETFLLPGDKINLCSLCLRTQDISRNTSEDWLCRLSFSLVLSAQREAAGLAALVCLSKLLPSLALQKDQQVWQTQDPVSPDRPSTSQTKCVCVMITQVNRVGRVCSTRLFASLWPEEHAHIQHLQCCYIRTFRQAAFTELFWIKETEQDEVRTHWETQCLIFCLTASEL